MTDTAPNHTERPIDGRHFDVVVAGARCAGSSTAMLLARQGLKVLVVDPARRGSDTLSTHALMRGGVLQLHRWGVLDAIRSAGAPAVRKTTFHYGDEVIEIDIKPRDGIDALYAPRRTLLDAVLLDAAEAAGAEVRLGYSVVGLEFGADSRVTAVQLNGPGGSRHTVSTDLIIGADGIRSRVAQLVGSDVLLTMPHATASIYGYQQDLGLDGFHWFYQVGGGVGSIPTNGGATCVFASMSPAQFEANRHNGLDVLYRQVLHDISPSFAERVLQTKRSGKLRAFAGHPGFMRQATGPGWALVGDAGYFKDPLTAHGITDALRDAELLARAVVEGTGEAFGRYQAVRDQLVLGLFKVTDRVASMDWDLEQVQKDHYTLSKEMNAEVDLLKTLDNEFVTGVRPVPA